MARLFSEQELDALQLKHFIFHILDPEQDQPRFLSKVALDPHQTSFFLEQFRLAAHQASAFEFVSQEHGFVHRATQLLSGLDEDSFLSLSRDLATDLHDHLRGNMSPGILILAVLGLPERKDHLFLLKMDHKEVMDYHFEDDRAAGEVVLEIVHNPIVQSADAIQKVAIISWEGPGEVDPETGEVLDPVWHLQAADRSAGKRSELTQYFARFLHMRPKMTDARWTSEAFKLVGHWAEEKEDELTERPEHYQEKVAIYVENSDLFEVQDFVEHVLQEEEEETRESLRGELYQTLEERGVAATAFVPQLKETRRKLITAEGLVISWVGSQESKGIRVEPPAEGTHGSFRIIIETDAVRWES